MRNTRYKTFPNITENLIYMVNLSYETGNYSRLSCHLFLKSGLFWLFCRYLKGRQLRPGWWGTPQTFFKRDKKDVPLFYVVNNFKIKYHNVEDKLLGPHVPADEASVCARHQTLLVIVEAEEPAAVVLKETEVTDRQRDRLRTQLDRPTVYIQHLHRQTYSQEMVFIIHLYISRK